MHSTVGRATAFMLYNAALAQKASKTPESHLTISPSAKLLKPFYWTAAIIAGLILFYSNNTGNNIYPLLIVPAVIVLWTLARHVRLRYTKLNIAAGKLRYETGIMSRSVRNMELSKVQDVRVEQSFMDRLLDLGTISIETAGETSSLTMHGIEEPQEIAEYILEAAARK
jgi:uncharacterized membrane protein YdbT with pleckstrin-like domain